MIGVCYTIYESYVNLQVSITPIVITNLRAYAQSACARASRVRARILGYASPRWARYVGESKRASVR